MRDPLRYGLEQARAQLPLIVSEAQAGGYSVITKHGKPCAAVVPLQDLEKLRAAQQAPHGLLSLRGTGRGLWGTGGAGHAVAALRDNWEDREPA